MTDHAALAARVGDAYRGADLESFAGLLAADVRWGDDDHPNRCRSRDDVIRTFRHWVEAGVGADVVDVTTGPAGVACRLHVNWVDATDRARGVEFTHVFLVRDGLISEICRYDDQRSPAAAIGLTASGLAADR